MTIIFAAMFIFVTPRYYNYKSIWPDYIVIHMTNNYIYNVYHKLSKSIDGDTDQSLACGILSLYLEVCSFICVILFINILKIMINF